MFKKLKPLSECETENTPGINKDMHKYFNWKIDVEYDKGINLYSDDNGWFWHPSWFEDDVKILEDELFEVL